MKNDTLYDLASSISLLQETASSTPKINILLIFHGLGVIEKEPHPKHFETVLPRLPVEARTLVGTSEDTALRLHELVHEQEADLVVLSAHGYSGKSRWTFGSIAHTFIAYGTTSLLLVQDFPLDKIEPTEAEAAAAEKKGH